MTGYVFRPSRRKNGKLVKSRLYSGRYRRAGDSKITTVPLRVTDREVAGQKLRQLIRDLEREEAGVSAPRRMRTSAKMALADHVAAFVADLRARNGDGEYAYTMEKRLKKLSSECGWQRLIDVTAEGFQVWRTKQTMGAKTLNDYLAAISQMFTWLKKSEIVERNPLTSVGKVDGRGKERRKRRACTPAQLRAMVSAAGGCRLALLTAYYTGLRRNELGQVAWGDICQDSEGTFIVARSGTTKNRKAQRSYVPSWFAAELRGSRQAGVSDAALVFAGRAIPSMWIYKRLLKQVGIVYKDEQGRQLDFHALRRSLNTHLGQMDVNPQVRQEIMRHSDIRLTLDVYTDKGMLPTRQAVEKLPMFPRQSENAQIDAHTTGFSGQQLARQGTEETGNKTSQVPETEGDRHGLAASDTVRQDEEKRCLARIRT